MEKRGGPCEASKLGHAALSAANRRVLSHAIPPIDTLQLRQWTPPRGSPGYCGWSHRLRTDTRSLRVSASRCRIVATSTSPKQQSHSYTLSSQPHRHVAHQHRNSRTCGIYRHVRSAVLHPFSYMGTEVSFRAFNDGSSQRLKGYEKIKKTCRIATERNLRYVWVDAYYWLNKFINETFILSILNRS